MEEIKYENCGNCNKKLDEVESNYGFCDLCQTDIFSFLEDDIE